MSTTEPTDEMVEAAREALFMADSRVDTERIRAALRTVLALAVSPSAPTESDREALANAYDSAWVEFEALGDNRDTRWRDFLVERLAARRSSMSATEDDRESLRDAIDHVQGAVDFQDAINPEAVRVIIDAARRSPVAASEDLAKLIEEIGDYLDRERRFMRDGAAYNVYLTRLVAALRSGAAVPVESLDGAWRRGFSMAYWMERGYGVERDSTPEHLVEDFAVWSPFRPDREETR